jgi:hypothetical protein
MKISRIGGTVSDSARSEPSDLLKLPGPEVHTGDVLDPPDEIPLRQEALRLGESLRALRRDQCSPRVYPRKTPGGSSTKS